MKTAIYCRVSTEEQAKEGFSIRAQQDKLKDYIKIKGWELQDIYIDEGISGKNITERPEINRLITNVMKKEVENVLVFKIDRLTRNTKDLISLMDLFNEHNCGFNSLMESIDTTTPSGRMFVKIIGIFAEFERENLIERISVACEKKAREGYTHSSFMTPYGYTREIGNREIDINEAEAKVINEIFLMYLEKHKTFSSIAQELNMRGISTNSGSKWGVATIKYILTNPLYTGKVRYAINDKNRYFEAVGKHEAIISEETFALVQAKISKMQRTIRKRPKEVNYYCGTLKCALCGNKMTTHGHYLKDKHGNDTYYCAYICSNRNNNRGNCNSSSMSHNKVDVAFNDYISNIKDFAIKDDIVINGCADKQEDILALKAGYENSLSKLLKKEKSIMKLYISDEIDFNEYNKMLELLRAEIRAFEEKLGELETAQNTNIGVSIEDIIINLKENWNLLTHGEKAQLLQTYIESIYVINEPINETAKKKTVKIKKIEYNSF